jgi:ethanolamine utilization protein EutN
VSPAAWVYLVANTVEKDVDIELVRAAGTGLYGRLIVAGTESAAQRAESTALAVIDSVRGTPWPVIGRRSLRCSCARGRERRRLGQGAQADGTTLLLVEDATVDGVSAGGPAYVAVDLVGAGEPELVLVVRGSSAARAVGVHGAPIDAAVVAILDQVRAGGRSTYEKR